MSNKSLINIKAFSMTNSMLLADLSRIADEYSINLGHLPAPEEHIKDTYYPQFNANFRNEASQMSSHYELFYCLERSIRDIVSQTIESAENTIEWWQKDRIPETIRQDVTSRVQKEIDSGITRRSHDELDYTTFGELSQIIIKNWDIFGSMFSSKKAVEKVMTALNNLRGPIAHCCAFAEDEVLRLNLTVRDWFRLME